ncbi:phosphopyruvate hydratase [bacterium CG10_46_32]|nr:MAG: phosphopyruvate hydratase [bacterium CG10_46_32]PIR55679.1 MAG: phosphopyruvate hydratase [Parcubacteria group bacterium CG10_big_fil_rev_8_21_14_0_10_46_32]
MNAFNIQHIEAGEILDSRGEPTVVATVTLSGGAKAAAAVPSGASTGTHEALELRDKNPNRYGGRGVLKAASNVNVKIADALIGEDAEDQERIDRIMRRLDGTENKSKLGANAILSVSLAVSRAVSVGRGIPLYASLQETFGFKRAITMPTPAMNLINGGKHGDTNITIQEFQIIPVCGETIAEKIQIGSEVFHVLGRELTKRGLDTDVGNEGGYSPDVEDLEDVFHLLGSSIIDSGRTPGIDITIGIDAAATEFYAEGKYSVAPPKKTYSPTELSVLYEHWIDAYQLASIEDPFGEDAWDEWSAFTNRVKKQGIMVIGDDLFVTNIKRLQQGIKTHAANAILVKLNQIGTLSETMEVIKLAQKNNMTIVVSHRSGETNDAFISDLAVAVGAEYLKAGAPSRGERVAKYNRLLEIEQRGS